MQAQINTVETLWENYFSSRSSKNKNELIVNYIWLVKFVLNKMTLPTNTILEEKDFLAIGVLGLNETIERFNTDRGVKFESYAIPRIRGIIKDELRKLDWLSRNTRKKAHEYLKAADSLANEHGREISSDEIMKKLEVDASTYKKYLAAAAAAKATISFNESNIITVDGEEYDIFDTIADESNKDFLEDIADRERIDNLVKIVSNLQQKQRLVMSLYYYEELTFREIGKVLSLTESRVCQIHSKVLKELKQKITTYENA